MNPGDALGTLGIAALAVVVLGVVIALTFGFTALIYLALLLTIVAFAVLFALCRDEESAA